MTRKGNRLFVAMVGISMLGTASAWEVPENPDRYPSMAIDGDISELDGSGTQQTDRKDIGLSLRLPMSPSATFDVRYDRLWERDRALGTSTTLKGNSYGATLRMYFLPGSAKREERQYDAPPGIRR